MLRTPRNYEFDQIESNLSKLEYKIDINDQMSFQLYTNNGFQLIDMFGENSSSGAIQNQRMMGGGYNLIDCFNKELVIFYRNQSSDNSNCNL
ncbi:MAG: hypothetical protein CBC95_006560, partial [Crocinitomicaceae bacterium TMED135]